MITVGKNLQLNTDIESVLRLLKQEAYKKGKSIFNEFRESGDHIMSNCPLGTHADRKPSFGVNKNNGLWNCFSCKEKGSLPTLIKRILDLENYKAGEQWLIDNFNTSIILENGRPQLSGELKSNKILIAHKKENKYVSEEELKTYRFYHPYMYTRGLTDDIIAKYDIGYDKDFRLKLKDKKTKKPLLDKDGNQIYSNPIPCLTFPVRDKKGNCLFIARRAINSKLFHYPESAEKPLYGLYEVYRFYDIDKIKDILVCESMLDALKFNAWNKDKSKFAFALNGIGDDLQYNQLMRFPAKSIIISTDNDEGGRKAKENMEKYVKHKMFSYLIIPKDCKDLNDMTEEQINNLNIDNGLRKTKIV